MVDATVGESLMRRISEEAYELLEDMALNALQWKFKRQVRRPARVYSIDTLSSLLVQMEILSKKMDNLSASTIHLQKVTCELWR